MRRHWTSNLVPMKERHVFFNEKMGGASFFFSICVTSIIHTSFHNQLKDKFVMQPIENKAFFILNVLFISPSLFRLLHSFVLVTAFSHSYILASGTAWRRSRDLPQTLKGGVCAPGL